MTITATPLPDERVLLSLHGKTYVLSSQEADEAIEAIHRARVDGILSLLDDVTMPQEQVRL